MKKRAAATRGSSEDVEGGGGGGGGGPAAKRSVRNPSGSTHQTVTVPAPKSAVKAGGGEQQEARNSGVQNLGKASVTSKRHASCLSTATTADETFVVPSPPVMPAPSGRASRSVTRDAAAAAAAPNTNKNGPEGKGNVGAVAGKVTRHRNSPSRHPPVSAGPKKTQSPSRHPPPPTATAGTKKVQLKSPSRLPLPTARAKESQSPSRHPAAGAKKHISFPRMSTQVVAGVQDKLSLDSHVDRHVVRDEVTDAPSSQVDQPDGDQILNNVNKETPISDGIEKDQSPTRRSLISAGVQRHSSPTHPSAAREFDEKVISSNSRPAIDQRARHLSGDKPKSTIEVKRPSLADNRRKKLMAFLAATPPPPPTTAMPSTNVNSSSSKLVEPVPVSIDVKGPKYMKKWTQIHETLQSDCHFVHPKKTEEVKKWLVNEGLGHARILILRGPSGCGKTATISTLAKENGFLIKEWTNKSSQPLEMESEWKTDSDDKADNYYDWESKQLSYVPQRENQVDQFCNFLLRASSYNTLQISQYSLVNGERVVTSNFPGAAAKPLVIVHEVPNAFHKKPEVLHEAIRNYKDLGGSPLVFIVTDSTSSACLSYKLFPPKLMSDLKVTQITLNPVANTFIINKLTEIARAEKLNIGKTEIHDIAISANGDIRWAINNLEFKYSGEQIGPVNLVKSEKGPRDAATLKGKKETQAPDSNDYFKDEQLFLFHDLGKVLDAKRDTATVSKIEAEVASSAMAEFARPHVLLENPDEVANKVQVTPDTFMNFLHQNYLSFYTNIDDVAMASSFLADSANIIAQWSPDEFIDERSPESESEEIPEPVLDDIFGLWDVSGFDDLEILSDEFGQDIDDSTLVLPELDLGMGFENDFFSWSPLPSLPSFPPGDSTSDDDDEDQMLDELFSYSFLLDDNSPPPTNPPSPHGELDNNYYDGSSSNSSCNSSQYDEDEDFIGEDLINEQPDIFDNAIINPDNRISLSSQFSLATNIFEENLGTTKSDLMWADHRSEELHHRDEVIQAFGNHIKAEAEASDDDSDVEMKWGDTFCTWDEEVSSTTGRIHSSISTSSNDSKLSEEAEMILDGSLHDLPSANPTPSDLNLNPEKIEKSCTSNKKNHKSNHAIQGIVTKEELDSDQFGGQKKTKIIAPPKDLMESLQQKTFLVAPLGPGKKDIRLTGSETVKGMLGVHTRQLNNHSRPNLLNHSHLSNTNKARMKKSKAKLQKERMIKQNFLQESSSSTSSVTSSSQTTPTTPSTSPTKPKKTKTHNNMERLRRLGMRYSFDNLKKLVPVLAKSAKCSKVEILSRAEEYVRGLRNVEKRLVKEETMLRSRNEALKLKLAQAQSQSLSA